jgi:hypothetical protein
MGSWRKLHNEVIHNLHSSPNKIRIINSRRMRWQGHVARIGEKRHAYRFLVGKPEGKRPLGRSRHGWENNSKMVFRESDGVARTGLIKFKIVTSGGIL